jgi:hypothetical protein
MPLFNLRIQSVRWKIPLHRIDHMKAIDHDVLQFQISSISTI